MIKEIIVIKSEYVKLKADNETMKKALKEIAGGHIEDAIFNHQLIASKALAEIGGDDEL